MIVQIEIYDIIGKASSLPRFCGDAGATQHHHLSASLSPLSSLPLPLFHSDITGKNCDFLARENAFRLIS